MTPETPIDPRDPNLGPGDPNSSLGDPNLGPGDPNFGPGDPNFDPGDPNIGPGDPNGGGDVRTDVRTEILPCVLQDFVPFGSAAQKGDPNQPRRPQLIPETTTLALETPILAPETPINPGDPN